MSYKQDLARRRNFMKFQLMACKGQLTSVLLRHGKLVDSLEEYREIRLIYDEIDKVLLLFNDRSKELGLKIKEIKIDDTI